VTRRNGAAAAALALALALAAGCGGGGGGDSADAGDAAPPVPAVPVATGASPAESATQAIAALGVPGAVEPGAVGASLAGFETFGAPHDAFAQQVRDGSGSGSEATAGAGPPPGPPPINGDPLVAMPGGTGSIPTGPGGEPGTGAVPPGEQPPVQSPVAYEADFDISGEPVVAREGDAIPPDTQQFVVDRVAAGEVTLKLSGGLLPDGTDSVTLKVGESITLFNATAGRTYRIKLVAVQRG
jgi:hypothetical protein